MRKYVDEYEKAVSDAMKAPDTAESHLHAARQYLQGYDCCAIILVYAT